MSRLGDKPGWLTADGLPPSWDHYQVGLTRLAQLDAREALMQHDAALMATVTDKAKRKAWRNTLRDAGGLS